MSGENVISHLIDRIASFGFVKEEQAIFSRALVLFQFIVDSPDIRKKQQTDVKPANKDEMAQVLFTALAYRYIKLLLN